MIDHRGDLIYVGKAKSLRCRLLTYFRPNSRDPKAGRILVETRRLVWEPWPDEFGALHRELELIRRWRPRFNTLGKPHSRQHCYICLGRSPAPYAYLARRPPARCLHTFGPIWAGPTAREAVRRLNDEFQLRDCPQSQEMVFAGDSELFSRQLVAGCLRVELGTCLGPCAARCTRASYADRVKAAAAFLGGRDAGPLERLQKQMAQAAAEQNYERAALLRDKWKALAWLDQQLGRLRLAEAMGLAIYKVQGHDGDDRWYVLHRGRAVAAVTAREQTIAVDWVAALAEEHGRTLRPADHVAGVLLLAAWFRRRPEELGHLEQVGLAR